MGFLVMRIWSYQRQETNWRIHHSRRATNYSFCFGSQRPETWTLRSYFPVRTPFPATERSHVIWTRVYGSRARSRRAGFETNHEQHWSSARNISTTNISPPSNRRTQHKIRLGGCLLQKAGLIFLHLAHATPELETGRRCCLKGADTKPSTAIILRQYSDLWPELKSLVDFRTPKTLAL